MLVGNACAEKLISSIEPEVRRSLSPKQEAAIRAAAKRSPWADHPLDLRLSLPTPLGRLYLVLLAGREQRGRERRRAERDRHPLDSLANICFGAGVTVMLAALALSVAGLTGLI